MEKKINSLLIVDPFLMRAVLWLRHPFLTPIMRLFTFTGSSAMWFSLAAVFSLLTAFHIPFAPDPVGLLSAMLGAFFALISGQFVKVAVKRLRPYRDIPEVSKLDPHAHGYSFPSTHTATAVGLAVGLCLIGHPLALPVSLWALIVSFSRYYLGVHYPSDILAGALWGAAFGLFTYHDIVRAVLGLG